jgi:hypothetical protein
MSNAFLEFLRLLKLGDEKTSIKAFNFLYPIAWRAACMVGYSKEDAEGVAFDTLISFPYKIGLWKIQTEDDLRAHTVADVYLRCLPFLENHTRGVFEKWKNMLEMNREETEQRLVHFVASFREIKQLYLSDFEQMIFNDRWLLRKDRSTIARERAMEADQVQSILEKIVRKMKSGMEEFELGWMLSS